MQTFYVTFGVQYGPDPERHVEHPVLPDLKGSTHWVEVVAEDYESARRLTFDMFGQAWSWLYKWDEFRPEMWPDGRIATLTKSGLRRT